MTILTFSKDDKYLIKNIIQYIRIKYNNDNIYLMFIIRRYLLLTYNIDVDNGTGFNNDNSTIENIQTLYSYIYQLLFFKILDNTDLFIDELICSDEMSNKMIVFHMLVNTEQKQIIENYINNHIKPITNDTPFNK